MGTVGAWQGSHVTLTVLGALYGSRLRPGLPHSAIGLLLHTGMYSQLRPLISLSPWKERTEPQASGRACGPG